MKNNKDIFMRPNRLKIEGTNICNANCLFCAYRYMTREKGTMSMDVFQKAIGDYLDIGGGPLTITPEVGDTLLDKFFLERLRYCDQFKEIGRISFFTNLIALDKWTDEQISEILEMGVEFDCSFGPNRDIYKKMYGVDKFEIVVHSLERLCNLVEKSSKKSNIVICGRAIGKQYEIDERVKKLILNLSKNVYWGRSYFDWGGLIEDLPFDTKVDRNDSLEKRKKVCAKAISSVIVFQDGRVGFCGCADFDAMFIIGDICSEHLIDILNGKKRREYLQSFGTSNLNNFCRKCTFYLTEEVIS